MKCVAVSDIHMRDVQTPEADLLIIAGDMTFRGTPSELAWFEAWLERQPQKHKVWIAGNHELGIEREPERALAIARRTGTIYLDDSATEVEGVRIWGSPVTPWFMDWAYNRRRGAEIRQHWMAIPEDLDILITHGPPMGYGDLLISGEHVGCEELLEVIEQKLKKPPRYHICGHLHYGYGRAILRRADGQNIEVINAASCNDDYKAVNAPVLFEV
jgi:Icc-related predicted phosphoesterase